jgi:hypothetical protein
MLSQSAIHALCRLDTALAKLTLLKQRSSTLCRLVKCTTTTYDLLERLRSGHWDGDLAELENPTDVSDVRMAGLVDSLIKAA